MAVNERTQHCVDDIRCPAIEGLPPETVAMLHHSLVDIVHMRRSIESVKLRTRNSLDAARESAELLRRLHLEGF
jgi:hypothetical protein